MNKKCLKIFTVTALLFAFVFSSLQCNAEYINETGNLSRLVTSNRKDAFATIDTSGDSIIISGVFKDDPPVALGIVGEDETENELHVETGGVFTAKITCRPFYKNYYDLYFQFQSGVYFRYVLKYDEGGWYVPDNGIAAKNNEKLENITLAVPKAAAYYISKDADKAEIEETLEEIQRISDEVCGDEEDDYEKAHLLLIWMGDNIYYDHDAAETSVTLDTVAIHNVLERRRTTCAGFANTYSALLEAAGIRSVNLKGAAVAGEITYPELPTGVENHEFSAFWYEKENRWVYADACWASGGHYRDGEYTSGNWSDRFFDQTAEAFALRHRADKAEERLYFQVLNNLDFSDITTDTEQTESEVSGEASTENENTEITESTDNTNVNGSGYTTFKNGENSPPDTSSNAENGSQQNTETDIILFVVIGLIGIAIIVLGVALALRKRKK